jgi:hypothetical protein
VCGDGALYFDAWSADDAERTIRKLMADAVMRDHLVSNGRERLKLSPLRQSVLSACYNCFTN